jgi:phosphohistidine phosphatase SixA
MILSRRRHLLGLLALLPLGSGLEMSLAATGALAAPVDLVSALEIGGCALMLRHAQTEAGVGDPANFRLGQCNTQRNLSAEGRAQARRMGLWLQSQQLKASRIRSSGWCRCLDTAALAFGPAEVFAALNSTFDNPQLQAEQTQLLRAALKVIPRGQFEIWVTHQVNISALTGEWATTGEAFVVGPNDAGATVRARRHFT